MESVSKERECCLHMEKKCLSFAMQWFSLQVVCVSIKRLQFQCSPRGAAHRTSPLFLTDSCNRILAVEQPSGLFTIGNILAIGLPDFLLSLFCCVHLDAQVGCPFQCSMAANSSWSSIQKGRESILSLLLESFGRSTAPHFLPS